jgi:hypothetical protein
MHGLSSSPLSPHYFLSLPSLSAGGSSDYVSSVYTCRHPQCLTHCARVNRVPMNSTLHLTSWRRQLQSKAASRPLPPKSLQAPSTVVLPQSSFLSFVAMFKHLDLRLGCQSVPFFRTSLRAQLDEKRKVCQVREGRGSDRSGFKVNSSSRLN